MPAVFGDCLALDQGARLRGIGSSQQDLALTKERQMLRRILVPMESTPAGEARLDVAISIARRHGAALTLLQVLGRGFETGCDIDALLAAEAAAQALKNRIEREGVRAEWQSSPRASDVGRIYAKQADLTILGRLDCQGVPDVPPESVVLASGRPILVVPGEGPFETIGRNVVIAWDGSREASRALRDALALMVPAPAVTVLCVNPAEAGLDCPLSAVIDYLRDRGIHAACEEVTDHDQSIAATLLARCTDLQADLLVMGAYRHSHLREIVLGGTTRQMLQDTTLPLAMSH